MPLLTHIVRMNIVSMLTDRIALIFVWQGTPGAHLITLFVTFSAPKYFGFRLACLALSTLENDTTLDSDENIAFMSFVLFFFGKSFQNVVGIDGDNSSTNHCIDIKLEVSLIGCVSHHLQLAMQELKSKVEETIADVHELIVKPLKPIMGAYYSNTHRCMLNNETRRTFTYSMLSRHAGVHDFVTEIDDEHLDDILLNASSKRKSTKYW